MVKTTYKCKNWPPSFPKNSKVLAEQYSINKKNQIVLTYDRRVGKKVFCPKTMQATGWNSSIESITTSTHSREEHAVNRAYTGNNFSGIQSYLSVWFIPLKRIGEENMCSKKV